MIRNMDDPRYKEPVIAQMYGEFMRYIKEQGLKHGDEFKGTVIELFSCSKRFIHIWDNDIVKENQMVLYFCSTQFMSEFGIHNKVKKKTTYRNKLENLRYKISSMTSPQLIDSHQVKYDKYFKDFKEKFNQLISEQGK